MDLSKVPPSEDVIDLRPKKPDQNTAPKPGQNPNSVEVDTSDKELSYDEPTGDIGMEMQPAMRGYGKAMTKKVNQWKVR